MKVFTELAVDKRIAEHFKSNAHHVQECISYAEAELNVTSMERGRVLSGKPTLVEIRESGVAQNLLILRFEAETRSR